jgi:hypothetical protein
VHSERPIGQTLLAAAISLAAIPLILQAITHLLERPYVFFVDANSETLQLTTLESSAASWFVQDALLSHHSKSAPLPAGSLIPLDSTVSDAPQANSFSGCVEVGPHAIVTLVRQGSGRLRLNIAAEGTAQHSATPAAVLRPLAPLTDDASDTASEGCSEHDSVQALQEATLEAIIGEQPLNGILKGVGRIGDEPYLSNLAGSPPLLRSGEVSVLGRRLLSGQVYTLMRTSLHLGDTVSVRESPRASDAPAATVNDKLALFTCLFSVVGKEQEGSGIELACHASGRSLAIGRYGDRSRNDLTPRPWDILINEPSMQVILPLVITGLFALLLRLLDRLYPKLCQRVGAGLARINKSEPEK